MSAQKRKQSKPKQRQSLQSSTTEKIPKFSNQIEDEYERILSLPILVPALCKIAALRAMMFSQTGIDYKQYYSSKIYSYAAYRLERMFNKLEQYPSSVLKAWVTNTPGYIVYSKRFLAADKVKIYRETMTPTILQQFISQGYIIKVEDEMPMPEFEAFLHEGGFEKEGIKGLPKYIASDHKTGQVLPIFRSDVIKYILGSIKRSFGLPNWYVALENKVQGLMIGSPDEMRSNDVLFSQFRTLPISPILKGDGYMPWNDKMRTILRNKYCLVWDGCTRNADMQLIQNYLKNNLYVVNIEGFHRIELRTNGAIIDLKIKTKTLISDNRKRKMIYKGIINDDDDNLFFKLYFWGEDISSEGQWSPIDIKTGNDFTIYYKGMSRGFNYTDTLLVNESLNSIVSNGRKRMYVVGRKGTMKTRFTRYVYTKLDQSRVKIIDSDSYGKWLLWMKSGKKDELCFDMDNLEVGTHLNYIEQLANEHFGQGRIGPRHEIAKLKSFEEIYNNILSDDEYGIRVWQLFIESQFESELVIYFVHSDIEIRHMIAANPTPVLSTTFNPLRVLQSRDRGNARQGQMLLGLFYDKYIPDLISYVEYKDLLIMCDVDVTVDID